MLLLLQDQLLFCDDCDRGYHMYCLSPPLSEPPEGEVYVTNLVVDRVLDFDFRFFRDLSRSYIYVQLTDVKQ